MRALRTASGAYEVAFKRASTVEGQCAVYTRVLREIGELYAARQRLGVDSELEMSFSIEGAIGVYATLRAQMAADWKSLGYQNVPREQYLDAMQRLWEEIQETSLNVGDYYLSRSVKEPGRADEMARNAARVYGRYLTFFHQYATEQGKESLPDSAYFAAFEAAKGVGSAALHAQRPTRRVGSAPSATAALMLFVRPRALAGDRAALGRRPAGRARRWCGRSPTTSYSRARSGWIAQSRRRPHRARAPRARRQRGRALHGLRRAPRSDLEHGSAACSQAPKGREDVEELTHKRDAARP
jgi:hypothetical protein